MVKFFFHIIFSFIIFNNKLNKNKYFMFINVKISIDLYLYKIINHNEKI